MSATVSGFSRLTGAILLAVACMICSASVLAEVKIKSVDYKDGGLTLKGVLVWDTTHTGKRPGILVMDEWWGLTNWAVDQARQLAAAGYVAFAADMYGEGRTTDDPKVAGKWMNEVVGDEETWNRRAQLGLDVLKADSRVDTDKLAVMGSSFGGKTAVQMAFAGHDIKAAVCIASSKLELPSNRVASVKPKILVFYGGDDKWTPPEKISGFMDSLAGLEADWQVVVFSGTRHSFTNPAADARGMDNLRYNAESARRSWATMMALFDEVFR